MPDKWEKLKLLATDSQYDLSCACSTSDPREKRRRGLDGNWLYPVPLAAGGYGIMFKTLLTNVCTSDCRYCPLRLDGNARRCSMTPDEVASAFMEHLRKQWLLGIFVSSGIIDTADRTMERLLDVARILRHRYRYRGYIHLKIIPGASRPAIDEALSLATAVSLNIEAPGRRHFRKLSDYKDFDRDIVEPLKYIAANTAKGSPHSRVKTSTQFIVGASDECDREIVTYLDGIYHRLKFERAYFSAYQAGLGDRSLPGEQRFTLEPGDRLTREHRLYQADFLLRSYKFDVSELEYDSGGNFDLSADPKLIWARRHPEFFPVRLATADRETLLRVPGLGPTYADRIIANRRHGRIRDLAAIGLKAKNADKTRSWCDFS